MASSMHSQFSGSKLIPRVNIMAAAFLLATVLMTGAVQAQTYSVIYSFLGQPDGRNPTAVLSDWRGDLFGTTDVGGADQNGTVFELAANGVETVLYSFTGGVLTTEPIGTVARDSSGNIYGAATIGGSHKSGFIFKVNPSGETVLHTFAGGTDGALPYAGVILDPSGNLYGTTAYGGGTGNPGTVFKIDSSNTLTLLHVFTGGPRGFQPEGGLFRDSMGNLYGTTSFGGTLGGNCGSSGCGTIFKLNTANQFRTLHLFLGPPSDGAFPNTSRVIKDKAGNLYGNTVSGGTFSQGTIFKIDPTGAETVLYSFTGGADGAAPHGGMVLDAAANLYGIASSGGLATGCFNSGCGTLFKLDTSNVFTVLHTFTGDTTDGGGPLGDLTSDGAGNIYGSTSSYGSTNSGTIFKLVP